jgi:hypothetical protein
MARLAPVFPLHGFALSLTLLNAQQPCNCGGNSLRPFAYTTQAKAYDHIGMINSI